MKKIKVSYLGLNSLFGRVTSNLLKHSPCIHKLTLYDDGVPSHAIEHSNVFIGRDRLQDAIKDVNIVVIGDEGPQANEENRLRVIGPKVIRYTEAITKFSPNAIVIVAASPLNVLFPLIGNFLGPDWQDRLLGTTSVDTLRASRALDGLLNQPQGPAHILPIIGGTSYSTRVPLFSHVCPQINVSTDIRDKIIEKLKMFDHSDSHDMDAIERAYTTVRFIHSVLAGMTRDTTVPEIAMTKTSGIPQTNYFSLPILIGRKGIERAADLPKMDAAEEKLFFEAAQKLSEDSKRAEILRKQFCEQKEADALKMETTIKMKDVNSGADNLIGKLQLKNTYKDPYPIRSGRTTKRKSVRKSFLGLPSVEADPECPSPQISKKPSKNVQQKGNRNNSSKPKDTNVSEEPRSDYAEILNKDVTDHLNSLKNSSQVGSRQKPKLIDENTDDEFLETLLCDVQEHLSSLEHTQQPSNLCKLETGKPNVPGVEAGDESSLDMWCVFEKSVEMNNDSNQGSESTEISRSPEMNSGITESKPGTVGSDAPSSEIRTVRSGASSKSPSVTINSAILDSKFKAEKNNKALPGTVSSSAKIDSVITNVKNRAPINISKVRQGLAEHEYVGAKNELQPDNHTVEKLKLDQKPDSKSGGEKTYDPVTEQNAKPAEDDVKKELTPSEEAKDAGTKTNEVRVVQHSDGKRRELRPQDDTGVKTETKSKKNENIKKPKSESGSSKYNRSSKQVGSKGRLTKIRGKLNSQVLNAFEADQSSGDHMSKSQLMMLKRKQRNEEKSAQDWALKKVGEDGDNANLGDSVEGNRVDGLKAVEGKNDTGKMANDDPESSAESSGAKVRSSWSVGRRSLPLKRTSDRRKHRERGKVLHERKMKPHVKTTRAAKHSERSIENPSNTYARLNSAITDRGNATTAPRRRHQSRNPSPQQDAVPPYANGSPTSKRIDTAIADRNATTRRNPSPKHIDFKSKHNQPFSSHFLTDAARVAKLNSIHKNNLEEINIERTANNGNNRFEPDFKLDENKAPQRGENKEQASKKLVPARPKKSDQTPNSEMEDVRDKVNEPEKDITSDRTMNYYMQQRSKGSVDTNNHERTDRPAKRPKHKKPGKSESKTNQRKKSRHPRNQTPQTGGASKIERNSVNEEDSKNPNRTETAAPRKVTPKRDNDQDPEDPWESKYFTKASEMFFKMFRDTVTNQPTKLTEKKDLPKASPHQTHDVFLRQPANRETEMRANPFKSEQSYAKNDVLGVISTQKTEDGSQAAKNASEVKTLPKGAISGLRSLGEYASKNGQRHNERPGKINIRFDKALDVKCKKHPEASTNTSDMCKNVTFHLSTRKPPTSFKAPLKEDVAPPKKEAIVSFDILFEESSNVPIIVRGKNEKWSGEKTWGKTAQTDVLQGVVATSDKGRGDAKNKVDFTVSKLPDDRGTASNCSHEVTLGRNVSPVKVPITSKTIKQVSLPYQMESLTDAKMVEDAKPDKSHKWERIFNVFKNIIINDIEGKRQKFHTENLPKSFPTISTANIAKAVAPQTKKPEIKAAPLDGKKGVSNAKPKPDRTAKRKYDVAKKKRPNDSKKGHVIKNNPKKIVNYFSKRGATAASYDRPRYDGKSYDQTEGLAGQTSASLGQSSTSSASSSK